MTSATVHARYDHFFMDIQHSQLLAKPRKRYATASNATWRGWSASRLLESTFRGNQDFVPGQMREV
jgi:hypothetical protein